MKLITIGHKNPDTDTVIAALVFADFLNKTKGEVLGVSDCTAEPAYFGELNKETKFVFEYFNQNPPQVVKNIKDKNVVLVDHGEYDQSPDGAGQANIVGVLDHHKMGGIETDSPIFYRAEPVGSTSTIIAKMFLENDVSFDKKTTGLLMSAIISDSLNLTSPTTTEQDKKIVKKLSELSGESADTLADKMFEAKSDISDIPLIELVGKDYKEYEAGNTRFGIGVWETTSPQKITEKKEEVVEALKQFKKKRKTDLMFFSVIDILKNNSAMFLIGEDEKKVATKTFEKELKNNLIFLDKVVSRKKQIVPPLTKTLKNYGDKH